MRRRFSHAGGPENQEINFLWPYSVIDMNKHGGCFFWHYIYNLCNSIK